LHGSLFFVPKRLQFLLKKGIMDAEESKKNCVRADADPQRPRNGKEHRFMKNWKKLLACLLVGLMALTVFTACDASVGAPMSPKRSNAESKSVKALRDKFKMIYNVEMTYNEDLSEKAYYVAYWVAGTSPSCSVNKEKTELSRKNSVDNVAKTYLNQGYYASAFDSMGIGKGIGGGMGADDFTPGFDIKPDPNSTSDIIFVLPKDGTYPEAMTKAAKGKTKLGVAYVVDKGVSYAVVLFG
jgi:hypothetical protein